MLTIARELLEDARERDLERFAAWLGCTPEPTTRVTRKLALICAIERAEHRLVREELLAGAPARRRRPT